MRYGVINYQFSQPHPQLPGAFDEVVLIRGFIPSEVREDLNDVEIDRNRREYVTNLENVKNVIETGIIANEKERVERPDSAFPWCSVVDGKYREMLKKKARTNIENIQQIVNRLNYLIDTIKQNADTPLTKILEPYELKTLPSDFNPKMPQTVYKNLDLFLQTEKLIATYYKDKNVRSDNNVSTEEVESTQSAIKMRM